VLAVSLALTAVWALSTRRLYRSDAVLVFEPGVQSTYISASSDSDSPRKVGARLADMLKARQRLEGLIKEMKLYPSIVDQRSIVDAVDEMDKHITVYSPEGYTYRVAYDAESRELAQNVLARMIKDVVDEDTRRRLRQADETKKFLEVERTHADEELKGKEAALSAFLAQHPALANETGGGAATAGALLRQASNDRGADSGGAIAALELQRANLEADLAAMGRSPTGADTGVDPALLAARSRAHADLQAAQRELADKEARYTNEHPDVKAALRRVADAEGAVRRAEAAAAAPHPPGPAVERGDDEGGGRAAALRRALAAVSAQINSLRTRSAPRVEIPRAQHSMVAIDTEFTRVTRDVSEARGRQQQLEAKQFQAELTATLAASGQAGRLVIADPPFRPMRPVAGGRFKIALVGGAASLALALLAIALLVAFDDRLYGAPDVERVVKDQIVVVIPRLTEKGG
jgi:uncharacterized protein involved in exopolysaccharide biosynthesis